jgi:hypothetical protein
MSKKMSKEDFGYLKNKRLKVLEAIKPICDAFDIKDYDYLIRDDYQQEETLRIYDTYIGCSYNSIEAVINELIGWIIIKIYCYYRGLGTFGTQTKNHIKRYWLSRERVEELKDGWEKKND